MRSAQHIFICLLFVVASAHADTHFVSTNGFASAPYTNWSGAARSIQAAVDAAGNGDSVLVSNGVYRLSTEIRVAKGVWLKSVNGAKLTTLDGARATRCVRLTHSGAVLDGFTVANGFLAGGYGAGVLCDYNGTVRGCTVVSNAVSGSQSWGGGVALYYGGEADGCLIISNRVSGDWAQGGGIYLYKGGKARGCTIALNEAKRGGGAQIKTSGSISDCIIRDNVAVQEWGGGAIIEDGGVISNSFIHGNKMTWTGGMSGGGGVCILNGGRLYGSVVSNNAAGSYGAGVYAWGMGEIEIDRCMICDNKRGPQGGNGGGVAIRMSGPVIKNSLVLRNSDARYGGGISFYDGGVSPIPAGKAFNCTFADNSSPNGVVYTASSYGGQSYLANCIIYGPANQLLNKGDAVYTNCCVYSAVPGVNNIVTSVPGFVDAVRSDFRLTSASPCIDRGTNMPQVASSYDGAPRPLDGNGDGKAFWDIGAYEFIRPDADTDGDGLLDQLELLADTDPRDKDSSLAITNVAVVDGWCRVNWRGGVRATQVLEAATKLTATGKDWVPVFTNLPPTAPVGACYYGDVQAATGRFYRLRVP